MEIPLLYDVRLKVCSQRKSTIQPGQLGIIAPRLSDPEPLLSAAGWDGESTWKQKSSGFCTAEDAKVLWILHVA